MNCPHCGEKFRLWQAIKLWVYLKIPYSWHERRERHQEATEIQRLKSLYKCNADLTDREHFVCFDRVMGSSLDDIAKKMNVTRERIRQIQAKALRKLSREHKND